MAGVDCSSSATVHSCVRFLIPRRLKIGARSTINPHVFLDSRMGISIGSDTMIGRGVKIFTLGHDNDDPKFGGVGAPVSIGDHVVLYPYSIIMPGVRIGDGAVVYPGSVVTKNVDALSVVGGIPARVLRRRNCIPTYQLNYKMYFSV